MPKDIKEESKEPKKKMVIVEEVVEEVAPKETEIAPVPVIVETKSEDLQKALNSEPKVEVETNSEPDEKTNYLWIIIPTALLIGALVGGLITYFSGLSKLNSDTMPEPTPVVTATPIVESTPVASPSATTLNRSELKVQILNGSGVSGAAGKAKLLLEGLGYKTVDTGNASMSDLAQTEVSVKVSFKENVDQIIKDLSKNYTAIESQKDLSSSSKYDVIITLGRK